MPTIRAIREVTPKTKTNLLENKLRVELAVKKDATRSIMAMAYVLRIGDVGIETI